MQSKEIVSCIVTTANIVDINDLGSRRKERIEKCLEEQMYRVYGDKNEVILKNPLLRISTKFEALSRDSQIELYGYAKGRIMGNNKAMSFKERLWNILEKGTEADGSWKDVEEFADTLLIKEKTYRTGI